MKTRLDDITKQLRTKQFAEEQVLQTLDVCLENRIPFSDELIDAIDQAKAAVNIEIGNLDICLVSFELESDLQANTESLLEILKQCRSSTVDTVIKHFSTKCVFSTISNEVSQYVLKEYNLAQLIAKTSPESLMSDSIALCDIINMDYVDEEILATGNTDLSGVTLDSLAL